MRFKVKKEEVIQKIGLRSIEKYIPDVIEFEGEINWDYEHGLHWKSSGCPKCEGKPKKAIKCDKC